MLGDVALIQVIELETAKGIIKTKDEQLVALLCRGHQGDNNSSEDNKSMHSLLTHEDDDDDDMVGPFDLLSMSVLLLLLLLPPLGLLLSLLAVVGSCQCLCDITDYYRDITCGDRWFLFLPTRTAVG